MGVCVLACAALARANAPAHAPTLAAVPECTFVHTAADVPGYNEDCDWNADTSGLFRANTSSFPRHTRAGAANTDAANTGAASAASAAVHHALPRGLSPPGGKYACANLCTDTVDCTRFVYRPHGHACFIGGRFSPPYASAGSRAADEHGALESWAYSACVAPDPHAPSRRTVGLGGVHNASAARSFHTMFCQKLCPP